MAYVEQNVPDAYPGRHIDIPCKIQKGNSCLIHALFNAMDLCTRTDYDNLDFRGRSWPAVWRDFCQLFPNTDWTEFLLTEDPVTNQKFTPDTLKALCDQLPAAVESAVRLIASKTKMNIPGVSSPKVEAQGGANKNDQKTKSSKKKNPKTKVCNNSLEFQYPRVTYLPVRPRLDNEYNVRYYENELTDYQTPSNKSFVDFRTPYAGYIQDQAASDLISEIVGDDPR